MFMMGKHTFSEQLYNSNCFIFFRAVLGNSTGRELAKRFYDRSKISHDLATLAYILFLVRDASLVAIEDERSIC